MGQLFQDAAFVARSFVRHARVWIKARFGEFLYDPIRDDFDTFLFVPGTSLKNGGPSIGALFAGESMF